MEYLPSFQEAACYAELVKSCGLQNLNTENLGFLNIQYNEPIINAIFLSNYGNYIYFGYPLIQIPRFKTSPPQSISISQLEIKPPEKREIEKIVKCPEKICNVKSEHCLGTDKTVIEECKVYTKNGKICEESMVTESRAIGYSCKEENSEG